MTTAQSNAWCFGCNMPAMVAPDENERRCGGQSCNGSVRRVANQAALDVGLLAFRMAQGHYVHSAALAVAAHPDAAALSPPLQPGSPMPVAQVKRRDGSAHTYDFKHYLDQIQTDPRVAADLDRIWLSGAYLVVGDALERNGYFDRAPELELIRHIRNGLAHGNKFDIRNPAGLIKFPAHNRLARLRGTIPLEITPALDGCEVLFEFAGPADFLDLLTSAELYLKRMGVGDPLRG